MTVVSHNARVDGARRAQAWKVLGAILTPCAVSARQIGTTPNRALCSAMNAQISGVAGRSPARRNSLQPWGFRWSFPARRSCVLLADHPCRLGRRFFGLTRVDRGLPDLFPQRLGGHTQLGRDRLDRGPLAVVVVAVTAIPATRGATSTPHHKPCASRPASLSRHRLN